MIVPLHPRHPFSSGLKYLLPILLSLVILILGYSNTEAHNIRGSASVQTRLSPNNPIHAGQEDHLVSLALAPEYYHRFDDGDVFTFLPFFRWDSADSERTHFDIRDFSYTWTGNDFEARVGIRKEFWGVVESVNLVDIVNQTDLVENPEGRDRLGQPMVNLSYSHEWGTFDFFLLPYFRERTFSGKEGRLRLRLPIDTDDPIYESAAEEHHIDFAFRYFQTVKNMDVGISHFIGTARDPLPVVAFKGSQFVLLPFYQQIKQTGLDLLMITGNWIWKFEGIYRDASSSTDYVAMVGGLEYVFDGIWNTGMDLSLILEYLYDDRGEQLAVNQDDIVLGFRWAFNDVQGTSVQASITKDLDTDAWFPLIKATTRLDSHWRLSLKYLGLVDQPAEDLFFDLREDDFFKIQLPTFSKLLISARPLPINPI